jgi:hypothetical protein
VSTLTDARTFLSRYGGAGNSFVDRLNFVIARLLPEVNSKGTKVPARFAVYTDNDGNSVVTLPRELESILAGAWQSPVQNAVPGTFFCGRPLPVRNDWFEFTTSGPGDHVGSDTRRGIIPLNGRFTTFADWNTPLLLRVKLEQTEVAGKIILRGMVGGQKVYSTDSGNNWIEGVELLFTNATVTTTQFFDSPPYEIVKTITKGRVQLYTVDTNAIETLVGYYEPQETNPSYQRYAVPRCPVLTTP